MNKVLTGNSLDVLKTLEDNSVDSVVTDPPYGYSFMGKDWDKAVPSVEIWQECLRVLKPGAFCMVMSAPRSDVQMHMISNLEQAGFRIDFTPIYWTYASGFPKAGNIGKMVDKRLGVDREVVGRYIAPDGKTRSGGTNFTAGNEVVNPENYDERFLVKAPATDQAKALDGSYAGFQPKPAVEVIIVAMKPLSEKTFVDQALKNRKGITWLDDVRIPYDGMADAKDAGEHSSHKPGETVYQTGLKPRGNDRQGTQGRFPANLLVSDDVLNDGTVQKSSYAVRKNKGVSGSVFNEANVDITENLGYADSGSYSRYFDLDRWWTNLSGTSSIPLVSELRDVALGNVNGNSTAYSDHEYAAQLLLDTLDKLEGSDASFCSLRNSLLSSDVSDVLREIKSQDSLGYYLSSFRLYDVHARLFSEGDPAFVQLLDDVHKHALAYLKADAQASVYDNSDHQNALAYLLACFSLPSILTYNSSKVKPAWANTLPFLITPKASKREKNEGLEQLDDKPIPGADTKNSYMGVESAGVRATHGKNVHPTVKPLKLMSYLITLTTREGDTVLDPFCGSGTTCIAAKMLKRDYIGIEREAEYVEIAEARLKAHEPELTLL